MELANCVGRKRCGFQHDQLWSFGVSWVEDEFVYSGWPVTSKWAADWGSHHKKYLLRKSRCWPWKGNILKGHFYIYIYIPTVNFSGDRDCGKTQKRAVKKSLRGTWRGRFGKEQGWVCIRMFDYFEIHGPVSISFIYRGLYWDGRDYFMTLKLCRIYIYSDCKYVNTYIETRHFWNMYIYKYIYIYV